jgi:NAD(P)-dependent dehydrogenase (short-subunit alcohol dehydrogenase family)
MKAQGKGSVVNIGSVYGHKGFGGGGPIYAASKFAIEGVTKCAALEGAGPAPAKTEHEVTLKL